MYTNSTGKILAANTAATLLGASVVSQSFGYYLEGSGDSYIEGELDANYYAPAVAANPNVTFLASTGDSGARPVFWNRLPSVDPNVIGVGGTTLSVTGSDGYGGETAWYGGGGGISNYFSEPSWQDSVQSTGFRTVPDVSADANPETGAAIYEPVVYGGWVEVGGTSLSSPLWGGMTAVADQGRVIAGGTPLGGPTQALPYIYALNAGGTNYAPPGDDTGSAATASTTSR